MNVSLSDSDFHTWDLEASESVIRSVTDFKDILPQSECCGSGSGRIRTFLPDPDPEISPPTPDPDPALVVFKKISVSVQYCAYVYLFTP